MTLLPNLLISESYSFGKLVDKCWVERIKKEQSETMTRFAVGKSANAVEMLGSVVVFQVLSFHEVL